MKDYGGNYKNTYVGTPSMNKELKLTLPRWHKLNVQLCLVINLLKPTRYMMHQQV